jgi:beta-phosphoglucomutase-like phosphatase (HAD superfamily)
MSGIAYEMQSSSEITHARILNRLFDDKLKSFHTEIDQPHGMSTYDTAQKMIKDEYGKEIAEDLAKWGDAFRTNMVAFERKRAKEIVEGVKAELQREEKELRDRMMGQLGH